MFRLPGLRLASRALILIALAVGAYSFSAIVPRDRCAVAREQKTVSGDSLHGLIENGAVVNLLRGYYQCHPTRRGDVVAYHAGKPDLIIKIVAAIPGETWSIASAPDGHRIVVNGQPLRNPAGQEYVISDRAARLLNLYVRDYQGVIPPDSYLLLGTATTGAYDSTSIGLIGQSDIVGKIEF